MNYGGKVLNAMDGLLKLLAPHCEDRTTIDALSVMLANHRSWLKAHDLFDQIGLAPILTRIDIATP